MHNTYSIGCIIPVYGPHKTAIMHPFDWIAAFRGLCVFSVEDLEPLIHQAVFFFSLSTIWSLQLFKTKTPGGVKPGWSCCSMLFLFFSFACGFCPLYIRGQWYSHAMQVGSAGPEGMSPHVSLWHRCRPLPEDSCRSSFHHADPNNRMTKTWL